MGNIIFQIDEIGERYKIPIEQRRLFYNAALQKASEPKNQEVEKLRQSMDYGEAIDKVTLEIFETLCQEEIKNPTELNEEERLIVFLLVNTGGKKKRRDNLIEIAEAVERFIKYQGGNIEKAASILSLQAETLKIYLSIYGLDDRTREYFEERKIDFISYAYWLSKFHEQDRPLIIEEILKKELKGKDLDALYWFKKSSQEAGIKTAIKRIKTSKPIKVFVLNFFFLKDKEKGIKVRLNELLKTEDIHELVFENFGIENYRIGKLTLHNSGLRKLREKAKEKRLSLVKYLYKFIVCIEEGAI